MTVRFWKLLFLAAMVAILPACQRDLSDSSKISIKLPDRSDFSKVGTLAFPTGRRICYGVNVVASDIAGFAGNQCAPKTGIYKGFAEGGTTVTLEVPGGTGRTVEVYAYLMPLGNTSACPSMPANMSGTMLLDTYLIGTASGIDTTAAETTVNIAVTYPGDTNHLATHLSAPASCYTFMGNNEPGHRAVAGGGIATDGTTFKIRATIGNVSAGSTSATGGIFKLRGNVKY